MKILVTGAAGFIGAATVERLCAQEHQVIGIDNLNDYYEVQLKLDRLKHIAHSNFQFIQMDIADRAAMEKLFAQHTFERVIHLAAQAGVRYSLENPHAYIDSNLVGHLNILEGCRHQQVPHLIYASSSSVYGLNQKMPFSVEDSVDHPVSLYAATKKADELMSHSYAHLYGLPTTGLRFFTVYGPWGRPDMALQKFAGKILAGKPIEIYNHGNMQRDFTYIDDIVEGIVRIMEVIPTPLSHWTPETDSPARSSAPYRLYNIGNGQPVGLLDFVQALEKALGVVAEKQFVPMQAGDVYATWADSEALFQATGFRPQIALSEGVEKFAKWYREYYQQR
ncbi:NAD-dependent epimerase [Suttonella ornithocola]|uniref:dTDP-glucose 4,6-dehydratase 2 n=1 Tax=Suttonella ornithocola TaxID=279832 RepID=A0A380MP73_9GAMM|nr:NAD-dependent epimerase [Suttonella ornithocola]SUO93683.1 dTDP-glucose 4,6-dehydratase 2 [Suttonella ornithocola]